VLRAGGGRGQPVHQPRQDDVGHRLHPQAQPDLHLQPDSAGLRHLVAWLPPGRHQPPRHAAAVQSRQARQLRDRLEDHVRRRLPLQRLDLSAGLGRHPAVLHRRQRPDRDPQRRHRPHPRLRGRLRLPGRRVQLRPQRRPTTTPISARTFARSPIRSSTARSTPTSTAAGRSTTATNSTRRWLRPAPACR
jgi:hypothetical protein